MNQNLAGGDKTRRNVAFWFEPVWAPSGPLPPETNCRNGDPLHWEAESWFVIAQSPAR